MRNYKYRLAWIALAIFVGAIACNFVTGLSQDLDVAKNTAQAAVTQLQELATEAGSLATAVEESGALKTAQALATEEGGKVIGTFEAMATQAQENGFLETAQAFATEGLSMGSAPPDIPVVDDKEIKGFFGSNGVVSYLTSMDFESVLVFYKDEMPKNDWGAIQDGTVESEGAAVLKFEKEDRTASVTLSVNPLDQSTLVMILVNQK